MSEQSKIATASTIEVRHNSTFFISKYMKSKKKEEDKTGRFHFVKGIKKECNEIGISNVLIDKKNYRVLIDANGYNRETPLVEGPDNNFYWYGFASFLRMGQGYTQGKFRRISQNTLKYAVKRFHMLIHSNWGIFLDVCRNGPEFLGSKRNMTNIANGIFILINQKRPIVFSIESLLESHSFIRIFESKQMTAWLSYEGWFSILTNNSIQFYSWPKYYDINAPMKFWCLYKIKGETTMQRVIDFINSENKEKFRIKVNTKPCKKGKMTSGEINWALLKEKTGITAQPRITNY